jgi:hypothetical protein
VFAIPFRIRLTSVYESYDVCISLRDVLAGAYDTHSIPIIRFNVQCTHFVAQNHT